MEPADIQYVIDHQEWPRGGSRLLRRLAAACRDLENVGAGEADVAGLVRQALLHSHLNAILRRTHLSESAVLVPSTGPWPSKQTWGAFSMDTSPANGGRVRVWPRSWECDWLNRMDLAAVDEAIAERDRRQLPEIPADPLVRRLSGIQTYRGPGQREAVHAGFLSPPGSTTIINLPTGTGKTLAFQIPAIHGAGQGKLTVVVVPTTSLARDQEKRFSGMLQYAAGLNLVPSLAPSVPLAFHSGLTKQQRSDLWSAVAYGGIPVVFVSPEAALGSLRGALYRAASDGRIRMFVVDEAHTICDWGDDFRPHFQALAGLRDDLLEHSPSEGGFPTLLLSATLTAESYDLLSLIFRGQAKDRSGSAVQTVAEVSLRPEMSYLVSSASSTNENASNVLEAVRHLPKPLLLYTTRREDASNWRSMLVKAGFNRIERIIGGDMATGRGENVLRGWKNGDLDIVVATSAFGLGVDQDEVRSVIHACVPESVERYYQEVGRSGRDGKAAVALMVWSKEDLDTAESMAAERVISVERGRERWLNMLNSAKTKHEDGVHLVDLDAVPSGYTVSSLRNRSWNFKTLTLMAQGKLLRFAAPPRVSIQQLAGESDDEYEARAATWTEELALTVGVRICDGQHDQEHRWRELVETVRHSRKKEDERQVQRVRALTKKCQTRHELLDEIYTIPDWNVYVSYSAGDCPVTRDNNTVSHGGIPPELVPLNINHLQVDSRLEDAFSLWGDARAKTLLVKLDPVSSDGYRNQNRRGFMRLLSLCARLGVIEFAIPEGMISEEDWEGLARRSGLGFVYQRQEILNYAPGTSEKQVPSMTVLNDGASIEGISSALNVARPKHIIMVPKDAPDPRRQDRRILDVRRHVSVDELIRRLDS